MKTRTIQTVTARRPGSDARHLRLDLYRTCLTMNLGPSDMKDHVDGDSVVVSCTIRPRAGVDAKDFPELIGHLANADVKVEDA